MLNEQIENLKLKQGTLDDKTFSSHLFKIVAIPVAVIFMILLFSHFEGQYRDKLRDNIEIYDTTLVDVLRLEKFYSDMETGQRGFVISGKDVFLEPFLKGKERVAQVENDLFKSIGGDYSLNTVLRSALKQYQEWLLEAEETITTRKTSSAEAEKRVIRGKEKFDGLRQTLAQMREEVIVKRQAARKKLERTRKWTTYLEFLTTVLFVVFLTFILTKQLKDLTRSYRTLLKSNFLAIGAIEKASKSKDLFLANMSHEIRTPLGAIMGFAELAGQSRDLDAATKNHISFIRRNSEHLMNLIDDLFDLSKLTADKLDIYVDDIDLVTFVDDIKHLFSSHVLDKNLNLNIALENEIPRVIKSDRVRFKQIVSNLVGNAIKFSGNGTKVDVVFSFHDKELVLDVIDQGIGMSDEAQKNIFEAFRQADSNHSRKYGGAGLGLSISKKLAEALSGDVVLVESKVNVGSHFRFRLPVKMHTNSFVTQEEMNAVPAPIAQSIDSGVIEKMDLSHKKILLAEDSKENQILFKIFIEATSANLTVVENGTDAVRHALKNDYDLILMDIQMPGLDGYEAVKILRSSNYRKKVIAITAHTMKGEREKCLAAGFDGYLSKPVSQGKLLRTIHGAVTTV